MDINNLRECKWGEKVHVMLMINKITDKKDSNVWAYCGDKDKEVQCIFSVEGTSLEVGNVVLAKGIFAEPFKPDSYEIVEDFNIEDFLPCVKTPIEEIMKEIEDMSKEEFKSTEVKTLNDYFFSDVDFVDKFQKAIGGVYNHHNYLGGLAEHTLGVMSLTKYLAYKYDCRYKEIAILGAKLHDIGKIYEMYYDKPFSYTLEGSMEGHIVMGTTMVDKAFDSNPEIYSRDFKERIKGIIVQHHGKLEYGSPIQPRSEESYIVHYADYVDAAMNKIKIVSEGIPEGEWSKYEKRIGGKLYL